MARVGVPARIRNRTERLRQRGWRMAAFRSHERHIIMGGAPRSGTTLLRRLFDRHPAVCAGAETKLFVPAAFNLAWLSAAYAIPLDELQAMRAASTSQGAFIDAFATRVREAAGKARWAEKTPQNIRALDWIMPRWPSAAVVHVIRDGRDVVCSMRQHPDWRWVGGGWQKVLVPRSVGTYARRWLADTESGLAWRQDPRYVEVRYEDLVADPGPVLRGICAGVGIEADPDWLAWATRPAPAPDEGSVAPTDGSRPDYEGAISPASVGRWQADLTDGERAEVQRLCGARLVELGYET